MNKTAVTISKAVGGAGAIVLVSLAAVFGINQIRTTQAEQVAAEQTEVQEAEFAALVVKFSSPGETTAVKTPTPPPVAAAPPVEEPVYQEPEDTGVSGIQVPWIPSTDPNNASGGDWDMSVCQGGSASTGADGVPYCD